jgi:cytochrome oxidase Cu insertion factor (SCO1/SenC/PrrC family)
VSSYPHPILAREGWRFLAIALVVAVALSLTTWWWLAALAWLAVLFVTVDPERDTAEILSKYVPAFDPRFLGLRGDADATARTAKEVKVIYQKQPGTTPGSYSMDHSAGLYVFDTRGQIRLYVGHSQGADVIAHDLRELLKAG